MKKHVRNTIDNETAFNEINFGDYRISLYWTKNAGMYGHQVVYEVLKIGEGIVLADSTTGCGYCKKSEALATCFRFIGSAPRAMLSTLNKYCIMEMPHQYFVGGNFYRVPKKDILKLKKRKY